ncbi:2-methylcitrate dehydratase [Diaporthe amygdali]|uniref:2-methylcitrate dehydratase n=1 Tax=Phomopsis amygdali TaxID=1214568 RepID=UPI0022FDC782|nr:2-methylcitrate dehydratase [Diaporthe amygdali]KAJ0116617.1 2-methylcitrate dehydratase [Diaporthe amygdali]
MASQQVSEPFAQENGGAASHTRSPTKAFAHFASTTEPSSVPYEVAETLKKLVLDYIGVSLGAVSYADSTPAFFAALKKLSIGESGRSTIFGRGSTFTQSTASLLNGALSHSLDFDDTYAPGTLHIGVTVITAALAQAETMPDLASGHLLAALAVGYETVCRISKAIGMGGYPKGFHNTSTCGIFGAVAAISNLRGLSAGAVENAFGLALSKTAGSMQYLENGAWNKRLHAGFAAADALLCVNLADAGVVGAAEAIEGKDGFLNSYAQGADLNALAVQDLGKRWELVETAIKPFPACRMTHGQIEMAAEIGRVARSEGKKVAKIVVGLPKPCWEIVGAPVPNKIHPKTVVDAQFSSYYQTATSYLYGLDLGWAVYEKRDDPTVRDLSSKIIAEVDESLKSFESKLQVEWADGTEVSKSCMLPLGERERPIDWEGVKAKFQRLYAPVYGEETAEEVAALVKNLENVDVKHLMGILGK